jgi:membrane protease YdiL (CAAX protease family)
MLSVALAFNIAGAVFEELLLRGILFRITEEALGTWLALAISALLFIGLHLDSPDAPILMIMFAGLAGGLLPSAAYTRTRRLWLPIGIHAGWDVIQNLSFGARFAGHRVPGVLDIHLLDSPLLTGGSMGLEGSIVALVAALALSTYLLVGAVQHGLIVQSFWRRLRPAAPAIA